MGLSPLGERALGDHPTGQNHFGQTQCFARNVFGERCRYSSALHKMPLFFSPFQKCSGTFFSHTISTEFRVNAKVHNKTFSIFACVNHRHCKTYILFILIKKQVVATILWPFVNYLHMLSIFDPEEMILLSVYRIRKNITFVVIVKLLPESSDFDFCDCFTDSNSIFHFISSRIYSEG